MTLQIVLISVIARIPPIHGFVQTIKPIRRCGQVGDLFARNILRHEARNRMADEHISLLNVLPQVFPDILLGAAGLGHQVTADLNVRAVHNWAVGGHFLDQGDETGHLRVINLFV